MWTEPGLFHRGSHRWGDHPGRRLILLARLLPGDAGGCREKPRAFAHQQIFWVKDRRILARSRYLWKRETCFMGRRNPNRLPKVAEKPLPSSWEMSPFARNERPAPPTPKPLGAFGIPMPQHAARGGLCHEPLCGASLQIMAGEAIGRRGVALGISPACVDVAVEHWQADTGRDGDALTSARAIPHGSAKQRLRPKLPSRSRRWWRLPLHEASR